MQATTRKRPEFGTPVHMAHTTFTSARIYALCRDSACCQFSKDHADLDM